LKTAIQDLILITPTVFNDARVIFEAFNQEKFHQNGIHYFIQDNQLFTKGTLRVALSKSSFAQTKLVRVLQGEIRRSNDLRKDSPTFGKHFSVLLSAENKNSCSFHKDLPMVFST
jgi:dTDP-4-dehydrorhamnose 3,5-epimerase